MKAKISELMDGELDAPDAARTLSALREEGEVRDAWRTYHLISDALRDTRMLSHRFAVRMQARLAEEPTVLAPAALPEAVAAPRRRLLLQAAAAGLAAVAIVGWLAFVPQEHGRLPAPPLAQAPQVQPAAAGELGSRVVQPQPSKPAVAVELVRVPPPVATDDYLMAHQGYSARNLLQGVAPYVRTVSGEAMERKR